MYLGAAGCEWDSDHRSLILAPASLRVTTTKGSNGRSRWMR